MEKLPQNNASENFRGTKRKYFERTTILNIVQVYGSLADRANDYLAQLHNIQNHTRQENILQSNTEKKNASEKKAKSNENYRQKNHIQSDNLNPQDCKNSGSSKNISAPSKECFSGLKQEILDEDMRISDIKSADQNEDIQTVDNFSKIKYEIKKETENDAPVTVKHEWVISDNEDEIQTNEIVISDSDDEFRPNIKRELGVNNETNKMQVKVKQEIVVSDDEPDINPNLKCAHEDKNQLNSIKCKVESSDSNTLEPCVLNDLIPVVTEIKKEFQLKLEMQTDDENNLEKNKGKNSAEVVTNQNIFKYDDSKTVTNISEMEQELGTGTGEKKDVEIKPNDIILKITDPVVKKEWETRTVYIGNLPSIIKKMQLRRFFQRYGKIENITINKKNRIHPLLQYQRITYSFIRYEKREDATKALEVNGMEYNKHHLKVQISKSLKEYDSSKTIFVRNIPYNVEEDDVWNKFETFGPILAVNLHRDEYYKRVLGYGYIHFESADSVELALKQKRVRVKRGNLKVAKFNRKGQSY